MNAIEKRKMTDNTQDKFAGIRPFYDEEVPAAIERLVSYPAFTMVSKYLFPEKSVDDVAGMLRGIRTIPDYQVGFMQPTVESVLGKTVESFTLSGLESLDPSQKYLYLSNHRDIALDATFLTYFIYQYGFSTPEISFGANLMEDNFVVDFGRLNKMFRVERPSTLASPRDLLATSQKLSDYIRFTLLEKKESVWIAQRNGRTKDGNDTTDQGIIKMFAMSHPQDKIDALSDLNIVPVAISYEWEPCDILKTLELYESESHTYVKKPGEDLNSILTGIVQQKGRVHMAFCDPVTRNDLLEFDSLVKSRYNHEVAGLVDRRIHAAYKLWPNNFIAHDLRFGRSRFSDRYTEGQKQAFVKKLKGLDKYEAYDTDMLKDIFLSIYSNPVDNALQVSKI